MHYFRDDISREKQYFYWFIDALSHCVCVCTRVYLSKGKLTIIALRCSPGFARLGSWLDRRPLSAAYPRLLFSRRSRGFLDETTCCHSTANRSDVGIHQVACALGNPPCATWLHQLFDIRESGKKMEFYQFHFILLEFCTARDAVMVLLIEKYHVIWHFLKFNWLNKWRNLWKWAWLQCDSYVITCKMLILNALALPIQTVKSNKHLETNEQFEFMH